MNHPERLLPIMLVMGLVILAAIVGAVLLFRAISRAAWRHVKKVPKPEVPAARVVRDRDQAP